MNYIVFDLEWNQGIAGKRESSHEEIPFEIIEIGAIKLDKRKNIIGQFQKIIKPSVYKKMPDIIEDMLHVDMKELKAGTPFPEAAEEFLAWCGEDFIFCSWGSLDLLELQRNMKYYQMPALAAGPICFLDIQKLFGIAFEHKKVGRTLEYAVDSLQIEKDIPFHRAFSDAYYTALVLQKIPADIEEYCSYDTYQLPKSKKEEIHKVFPSYSKYISRSFPDKGKAMEDREVLSTRCYICDKAARKKIRWFTPNGKHYYSVSYCEKHGYLKGKIRIRKNICDPESVFVIKTMKLISKEDVDKIIEKRNMPESRDRSGEGTTGKRNRFLQEMPWRNLQSRQL